MRLCILLLAAVSVVSAQSISSKLPGLTRQDGFLPYYWDTKTGKLWLVIPKLNEEFLYVSSLPAGLGSNDIGLDRGQLGRTRIVRFERSGNKVLLVQPNYNFRASSDNPDERRAVAESFASAVIWGFTVEAEENGQLLVDATNFFLRDAHGARQRLQQARQGAYTLDASRSAFYLPRTKAFPRNTEVEVTLTFTGDPQGRFVQDVAASPDALTLRQHHSFVQLPGPGYTPRRYDPRSGFIERSFFDYSTPVAEPINQQHIIRHRLTKDKPIVYYLDRGTPEPIRSALLDGARWWTEAFTAAGFPDGFRVEMMPEGADSMDTRYNVIQWVHRATRGWSYGSAVVDPRTGEIIKGHVTLGSLRVRQDYLIAEGLLAPYEQGKPANPAMLQMALQRLRQLSAHEVGHTIGLVHNYVSSAQGDASVMDYPHPNIGLKDGLPDLSASYTNGIGEWDKVAIRYGYAEFPAAQEQAELNKILADAYQRGLYLISDDDSRPESSAHPQSHLWDNGKDATAELTRILEVRRAALARFGENNIPMGRPYSTLQESLVTTYLLHRYQTEAAVKVVGGLNYTYATRGDGQLITRIVPAAEQRKALAAVLKTLDVNELTIPERILQLLPPAAEGFPRTREYFRSRTGLTFDALTAAESAAHMTAGLLLNGERAGRLIQYKARDAQNPGLEDVIRGLVRATFSRPAATGLAAEVGRTVDHVVLTHLLNLLIDDNAVPQVRAIVRQELANAMRNLSAADNHQAYLADRHKRFLADPKPIAVPRPTDPPPGMPIGMDDPYCNFTR